MKTRPFVRPLNGFTLVLFGGLLYCAPLVLAQGTAFTYQGQLSDGGGAANGVYDLSFAVYGVASGGSPVTGPVTNSAVAISSGQF